MPVIMLVDNGSVRAAATLQLRLLAKRLGEASNQTVHPVSLRHADKILTEKLNDLPAHTFQEFIRQQLLVGERDFLLVPLFFGESRALTAFVPDVVQKLKEDFGVFKFETAAVIYPLPDGDQQLVSIIYDHIIDMAEGNDLPLKNIVLVDHGSPSPMVTAVRQHLSHAVQDKLPHGVLLEQAVMERREGAEYDFNGALLEEWLLNKAQAGEISASVILLFFLPGRHAGNGGDITEICDAVMKEYPSFKIAISPLISEHPLLLSILESRLKLNV